jgi:hypothetical protein
VQDEVVRGFGKFLLVLMAATAPNTFAADSAIVEGNGPDHSPHNPDTIPQGTIITTQNWRKYREFLPDGMAAMFEGKYFWKMPPDVQMEVGPTAP